MTETEASWDAKLDEMIWALDCVANQFELDADWELSVDQDRLQHGLLLFGVYLRHLWW